MLRDFKVLKYFAISALGLGLIAQILNLWGGWPCADFKDFSPPVAIEMLLGITAAGLYSGVFFGLHKLFNKTPFAAPFLFCAIIEALDVVIVLISHISLIVFYNMISGGGSHDAAGTYFQIHRVAQFGGLLFDVALCAGLVWLAMKAERRSFIRIVSFAFAFSLALLFMCTVLMWLSPESWSLVPFNKVFFWLMFIARAAFFIVFVLYFSGKISWPGDARQKITSGQDIQSNNSGGNKGLVMSLIVVLLSIAAAIISISMKQDNTRQITPSPRIVEVIIIAIITVATVVISQKGSTSQQRGNSLSGGWLLAVSLLVFSRIISILVYSMANDANFLQDNWDYDTVEAMIVTEVLLVTAGGIIALINVVKSELIPIYSKVLLLFAFAPFLYFMMLHDAFASEINGYPCCGQICDGDVCKVAYIIFSGVMLLWGISSLLPSKR